MRYEGTVTVTTSFPVIIDEPGLKLEDAVARITCYPENFKVGDIYSTTFEQFDDMITCKEKDEDPLQVAYDNGWDDNEELNEIRAEVDIAAAETGADRDRNDQDLEDWKEARIEEMVTKKVQSRA